MRHSPPFPIALGALFRPVGCSDWLKINLSRSTPLDLADDKPSFRLPKTGPPGVRDCDIKQNGRIK